jgi:ATP-dependent Clp protease ATP-binding subunit ClpC
MFERFTELARRAVVLAQEESRLLGHSYIGTEHLLLGLLANREGVADRALESLGITLDAARAEVREIIGPGQEEPRGHIPFTPRAKKILELSLREALNLGSEVIGTGHLLLGLVDEGDGVGAKILARQGASASAVREAVIALTDAEPESTEARPAAKAQAMTRELQFRADALIEVKELLVSIERRLSAIERHLGIADDGQEEPPAATAE